MSDVAREMLRGFGLAMGLDVQSNQRLAKLREIREQEFAQRRAAEPEPTVELVVRKRPRSRRALTGSLPWIPVHSVEDVRDSLGDEDVRETRS